MRSYTIISNLGRHSIIAQSCTQAIRIWSNDIGGRVCDRPQVKFK